MALLIIYAIKKRLYMPNVGNLYLNKMLKIYKLTLRLKILKFSIVKHKSECLMMSSDYDMRRTPRSNEIVDLSVNVNGTHGSLENAYILSSNVIGNLKNLHLYALSDIFTEQFRSEFLMHLVIISSGGRIQVSLL